MVRYDDENHVLSMASVDSKLKLPSMTRADMSIELILEKREALTRKVFSL
jgi:hypothetical protein